MSQARDAIITARCTRSASKPFQTQYGQRVTAEFLSNSGEEIKVFDDSDSSLAGCEKGDQVELIRASRGWRLGRITAPIADEPRPAAAQRQAATVQSREDDTRKQMEAITREVKRLAFCMEQVKKNSILSQLSEEAQRAAATTVFIQTSR